MCPNVFSLLLVALVPGALASISGSHWVILPSSIVPGEDIPLTFTFFNTTEDVEIQVDLLKDDHHRLSYIRHTFVDANPEIVMLPVPADILYNPRHPSYYTLLVHGLRGLFFVDHARLSYNSGERKDVFAMHIQTDKAVYKPGQTVQFRSFGMFSNMTVYTGAMNISVFDPKGNHMKYITNATEPAYGVVEDFMLMDSEPVLGDWYIDVTAHTMGSTRKYFTVDKYVLPKFDVQVDLPPFVLTSDNEMHGTVKAKYTYGKPVIGKILLTADLDYYYSPWKYHGDEVMVELHLDINGEAKFTIPFDQITNEVDPNNYVPLVERLVGNHVLIKASVTESLNNLTRNATSQVQFYKQPFKVEFIRSSSPSYFKPGLPYTAHVTLTQADGRPIVSTDKDVELVTYVKFYDETSHKDRAHSMPTQMLAPPPTGVLVLNVDPPKFAKSLHLEVRYKGLSSTLNINKPYWLMTNGTLQLSMNSTVAAIGRPATFKVLSVDPIDTMFYLVMANDLVVHTGMVENGGESTCYISFNVSHKMEPYGHLIVYYISDVGEWNADSIYFSVNDGAEIFKNQVDLSFSKKTAEPGDDIVLDVTSDPRSLVNILAVDQSVLLLKTGNDVTQQDVITSLKSASPPSQYNSNLHDPQRVMQTRGMQILTDVSTFSWAHPAYKRQVNCGPGLVPGTGTSTGGATGTGELVQVKRTRDFFPETWLWTNVTTGADGSATIASTVPDTITSWVATAFSVNKLSGLGITGAPAKFTTFRPFFVSLNLPYSVIRGEEVVLQANIFNYMGQDQDVVVTLQKSDDFRVIQKDSAGHTSYVSQDIVKTVRIAAGRAESVFIPIVAAIVGMADISVKTQTVLAADGVKRQLLVKAEGSPMFFNIPVILGGQSNLDVDIAFPPNFVMDSQVIKVSAVGDVMGPAVNNLQELLRMPGGCGEQTMTSLAPDVFIYNYLKLTNQLTPKVADQAISYMHKGYQRELTFQHRDGSFSIWGQSDSQGSMWLTAFVLKSFHQAAPYIYVSENVLYKAANWIMRFQNYDGSFRQIGSVHSTSLSGGGTSGFSLTAFVLIALVENDDIVTSNVVRGTAKARAYIEAHLHELQDPYDLAIVSYALAKSGSSLGAVTFSKLDKLSVMDAGKKSWRLSTSPRPTSWDYVYYQHPPLEVEVASYALMYLIQSRQLGAGLPVLKWLISQRNSLGGFRSTQDTVLGLQAMSEYGAMLTGNLDLNVGVSATNFSSSVHLGRNDAMVLKIVDVPPTSVVPTGSKHPIISLAAQGNGSALVQVSVSFNVETEVTDPAFNVTTSVLRETLRSIVVQTCAAYLPAKFTALGMSVIELDIPTGFTVELESDVTDTLHVKKTELKEQTLVLYYDQIAPVTPTCATVEMIRTDLVAKTKPATVRVYDYYNPELRALDVYESTLLKDSSFCDICSTCGC